MQYGSYAFSLNSSNTPIQHPRQRGPPLPRLRPRGAGSAIYVTGTRPIFAPSFSTLPGADRPNAVCIPFPRPYGRPPSKTACRNSVWFESYDSDKIAVLASRMRSAASSCCCSPDRVPPIFFKLPIVVGGQNFICLFLMVVAMRHFSF